MPNIGLYLEPNQIQTLVSGQKLTSCEPKLRIDKIDSSFVQVRNNSIGKVFDVADEGGKIRTKAKLIECYITTFGNPKAGMVSGLGFGTDVQRYKSEYSEFWKKNFPEEMLTEESELFVTVWEHAQ